jgi:STE24 endopeptidase
MSAFQIFIITAAFLQLLCQLILKWKNQSKIKHLQPNPPEGINSIMDVETWNKTSNYATEKSRLSNFEEIFSFLIFLPVFLVLMPWYFQEFSTSNQVGVWESALITCLFLFLLQIPQIPVDWYNQFVLEEKYGFNKSTKKLWVSDKIKGVGIGLLLGCSMLSLLIFLYRECSILFPNFWWIISFCVFFSIQLVMMVLWPKLILPLFNKLSPLEDGELKQRLIALAEKSGFHAKTIEIIDGSKRSGHSNAFFTGFGKFRRIVLYDTLIKQMEPEEIEAVLAHEVGHYIKGHIPKKLLISFITGLCMFGVIAFALSSIWIYKSAQFPSELHGSLCSVLVLLSLTLGYITYWFSPISNMLSRKHEYEADNFAKEMMGGPMPLVLALRKLYKENLTYPLPHKWISAFHYSHPTIMERENALNS